MGSHCSSCWGEEDGVWSLVPMVATATADTPQTGLFKNIIPSSPRLLLLYFSLPSDTQGLLRVNQAQKYSLEVGNVRSASHSPIPGPHAVLLLQQNWSSASNPSSRP